MVFPAPVAYMGNDPLMLGVFLVPLRVLCVLALTDCPEDKEEVAGVLHLIPGIHSQNCLRAHLGYHSPSLEHTRVRAGKIQTSRESWRFNNTVKALNFADELFPQK